MVNVLIAEKRYHSNYNAVPRKDHLVKPYLIVDHANSKNIEQTWQGRNYLKEF